MKQTALPYQLLFVAISLLLVSCGSTSSKQAQAKIEGIITDQFSNTPLAGVNISLQGTSISSVTDANGFYSISGLEEGSYTIIISKNGYEEKNSSVSVTTGSSTTVSVSTRMMLSWDFNVTDRNHTIGILSNGTFDINGASLANGDILGVFYLKGNVFQCGGRIQRPWDGNSTAIAAYGDDTFTEDVKDGFNDGETFVWVLRKSNGTTFRLLASYEQGGNTFQTNGISKVVGLRTE